MMANTERFYKCQCGAQLDMQREVEGVVKCPYCGNKVAVPQRATSNEALDMLRNGKHALACGHFEDAAVAYQSAQRLASDESEAYFGMALAAFKVQYIKDEVNDCWQPICYDISDKTFTDDKNYRRALELATVEQKKVYRKQGQEIDDIRDEFYALEKSGLDYDCFICVKVSDDDNRDKRGNKLRTQDSDTANEIYYHLKDKGYKPFYSEREIKGRAGSAYEAMILYALVKSECMLIVCSNAEYLNTPWVKNEYVRFLTMVTNDEKERDALTFVFDGTPIEKLPNGKKIQGINLQWRDAYPRIEEYVASHTQATKRKIVTTADKSAKYDEQSKLIEELQRKLDEVTKLSAFTDAAEKAREAEEKAARQAAEQKRMEEALRNPTLGNYVGFRIYGTEAKEYLGKYEDVIVPKGVTSINHTFAGKSIIKSVVVPNSVTDTTEAFWGCKNLKSVTLPDNLIIIARQTFHDCTSLTDVNLPSKLLRIDDRAFYGCSSLTHITIPEGVSWISGNAFYGTNLREVVIPRSLISPLGGFANCRNLVSVTIPDTITEIDCGAFTGCESLESIAIPPSVTKIGYHAFMKCNSLTSLTIPDTVKKLKIDNFSHEGPFVDCQNLKNVTMPKRLAGLFGSNLKKLFGERYKEITFTFTDGK